MDPLKGSQRAERNALHIREAEVQLGHLVSAAVAGVGHGHVYWERLACLHRSRQGESSVSKCGVAEPIAERVERYSLKVSIGAALHRVDLEERQLAHIFVEGHGQPARGVILVGEGLGHSCATL